MEYPQKREALTNIILQYYKSLEYFKLTYSSVLINPSTQIGG